MGGSHECEWDESSKEDHIFCWICNNEIKYTRGLVEPKVAGKTKKGLGIKEWAVRLGRYFRPPFK